jgi:hypothetical protein
VEHVALVGIWLTSIYHRWIKSFCVDWPQYTIYKFLFSKPEVKETQTQLHIRHACLFSRLCYRIFVMLKAQYASCMILSVLTISLFFIFFIFLYFVPPPLYTCFNVYFFFQIVCHTKEMHTCELCCSIYILSWVTYVFNY